MRQFILKNNGLGQRWYTRRWDRDDDNDGVDDHWAAPADMNLSESARHYLVTLLRSQMTDR